MELLENIAGNTRFSVSQIHSSFSLRIQRNCLSYVILIWFQPKCLVQSYLTETLCVMMSFFVFFTQNLVRFSVFYEIKAPKLSSLLVFERVISLCRLLFYFNAFNSLTFLLSNLKYCFQPKIVFVYKPKSCISKLSSQVCLLIVLLIHFFYNCTRNKSNYFKNV